MRNDHQPESDVQTGIGPVTIKVPRVRTRDEEPVTFRSALVSQYVHKTKSLEIVVPWPYVKCVSTGDLSEVVSAPRLNGFVS